MGKVDTIYLTNNTDDVYEIKEDKDSNAITFTNPRQQKPTLREIIYYHIIERPYDNTEVTTSDYDKSISNNYVVGKSAPVVHDVKIVNPEMSDSVEDTALDNNEFTVNNEITNRHDYTTMHRDKNVVNHENMGKDNKIALADDTFTLHDLNNSYSKYFDDDKRNFTNGHGFQYFDFDNKGDPDNSNKIIKADPIDPAFSENVPNNSNTSKTDALQSTNPTALLSNNSEPTDINIVKSGLGPGETVIPETTTATVIPKTLRSGLPFPYNNDAIIFRDDDDDSAIENDEDIPKRDDNSANTESSTQDPTVLFGALGKAEKITTPTPSNDMMANKNYKDIDVIKAFERLFNLKDKNYGDKIDIRAKQDRRKRDIVFTGNLAVGNKQLDSDQVFITDLSYPNFPNPESNSDDNGSQIQDADNASIFELIGTNEPTTTQSNANDEIFGDFTDNTNEENTTTENSEQKSDTLIPDDFESDTVGNSNDSGSEIQDANNTSILGPLGTNDPTTTESNTSDEIFGDFTAHDPNTNVENTTTENPEQESDTLIPDDFESDTVGNSSINGSEIQDANNTSILDPLGTNDPTTTESNTNDEIFGDFTAHDPNTNVENTTTENPGQESDTLIPDDFESDTVGNSSDNGSEIQDANNTSILGPLGTNDPTTTESNTNDEIFGDFTAHDPNTNVENITTENPEQESDTLIPDDFESDTVGNSSDNGSEIQDANNTSIVDTIGINDPTTTESNANDEIFGDFTAHDPNTNVENTTTENPEQESDTLYPDDFESDTLLPEIVTNSDVLNTDMTESTIDETTLAEENFKPADINQDSETGNPETATNTDVSESDATESPTIDDSTTTEINLGSDSSDDDNSESDILIPDNVESQTISPEPPGTDGTESPTSCCSNSESNTLPPNSEESYTVDTIATDTNTPINYATESSITIDRSTPKVEDSEIYNLDFDPACNPETNVNINDPETTENDDESVLNDDDTVYICTIYPNAHDTVQETNYVPKCTIHPKVHKTPQTGCHCKPYRLIDIVPTGTAISTDDLVPEGVVTESNEQSAEDAIDFRKGLMKADRNKRYIDYANVPEPPSLSELDLNDLPDFIKTLLSTNKPASPSKVDQVKRNVEDVLEDQIYKLESNVEEETLKEKQGKTYGMILSGSKGKVWNDFNGPQHSYGVGEFSNNIIKKNFKRQEKVTPAPRPDDYEKKTDVLELKNAEIAIANKDTVVVPNYDNNGIDKETDKSYGMILTGARGIVWNDMTDPKLFHPVGESTKEANKFKEESITTKKNPVLQNFENMSSFTTTKPDTEDDEIFINFTNPTDDVVDDQIVESLDNNMTDDISKMVIGKGKTYGMSLVGGNGFVWNDLNGQRVTYDVGEPSSASKVSGEELITPAKIPEPDDIADLFVSIIRPTSSDDDTSKELYPLLDEIPDIFNKTEANTTLKPLHNVTIKPDKEDTTTATLIDIDIVNTIFDTIKDSIKNESTNINNNVPNVVESTSESVNVIENATYSDNTANSQSSPVIKELMKNKEFWEWLRDSSVAYLDLLMKQLNSLIKAEVSKQIKEYVESSKKIMNEQEKNGSLLANATTVEITPQKETNTEETGTKFGEASNQEDVNTKKHKDKEEDGKKNKEPVTINAQNIFGSSVGSGKVTNIFIFNISKESDLSKVKPLNNSTNGIYVFGADTGLDDDDSTTDKNKDIEPNQSSESVNSENIPTADLPTNDNNDETYDNEKDLDKDLAKPNTNIDPPKENGEKPSTETPSATEENKPNDNPSTEKETFQDKEPESTTVATESPNQIQESKTEETTSEKDEPVITTTNINNSDEYGKQTETNEELNNTNTTEVTESVVSSTLAENSQK